MNYNGTTINNSSTICGISLSDIKKGQFHAVEFDTSGKLKIAGAGANAIGLLMAEASDIKTGDQLDVQVKDIGLWMTGGAVKAGDELTSNASGAAVKATAGKFITAVALESAETSGVAIQVQIIKAGYKA